MDRKQFLAVSARALEHIERVLGDLELEELDANLGGDVLTLAFSDGAEFIINAHSAAGQIWMAAGTTAWQFDLQENGVTWVAPKTEDELMATVSQVVSEKLGRSVEV